MAETTKSDQLAAQRTKRATKSTAKRATAKKSTAKKSTAKAATKSTAKRSTAKSTATARTPRTKGSRYHLRQVLKDAVAQGTISAYTMRGISDENVPSTIVLADGTKAFPKTPAEAVTALKGAGYKPGSDKAVEAVAAIAA